mmetsp:Transcript_2119/g.3878  ORF Transcript_2119/g.3878 Transcript_2119/m.3878 type:complete len:376 (-) Transcript_2119:135-1262(-)
MRAKVKQKGKEKGKEKVIRKMVKRSAKKQDKNQQQQQQRQEEMTSSFMSSMMEQDATRTKENNSHEHKEEIQPHLRTPVAITPRTRQLPCRIRVSKHSTQVVALAKWENKMTIGSHTHERRYAVAGADGVTHIYDVCGKDAHDAVKNDEVREKCLLLDPVLVGIQSVFVPISCIAMLTGGKVVLTVDEKGYFRRWNVERMKLTGLSVSDSLRSAKSVQVVAQDILPSHLRLSAEEFQTFSRKKTFEIQQLSSSQQEAAVDGTHEEQPSAQQDATEDELDEYRDDGIVEDSMQDEKNKQDQKQDSKPLSKSPAAEEPVVDKNSFSYNEDLWNDENDTPNYVVLVQGMNSSSFWHLNRLSPSEQIHEWPNVRRPSYK